jgi:hypothetical protein
VKREREEKREENEELKQEGEGSGYRGGECGMFVRRIIKTVAQASNGSRDAVAYTCILPGCAYASPHTASV